MGATESTGAMGKLRERLAELSDLSSVQALAEWDQLVMMPSAAADARARQTAALERVVHERATAPEVGEWLQELEQADLDEVGRDIVRVARRDWERARRVPGELVGERADAAARGQEIWQVARKEGDFQAFAPALARNVQLARAYGEAVAEGEGADREGADGEGADGEGADGEGADGEGADAETPYEGLLGDYDFGLRVGELERVFAELAQTLPGIVEEAMSASPRRELEVPVEAQKAAVAGVLAKLGVEEESWRVDVSAHPFSTWVGVGDTRITTRYDDGGVEALLSSIHEYGHALYERQVEGELARTNLGEGTSMSVHESQSKLWENHVGRNRGFVGVMAGELGAVGFTVSEQELFQALTGVERSLIRVAADPVTYPLHIVLRFELEMALIEGEMEVGDLPEAWREGMRRLVGVEVPSDRLGCLQDVHWSAGSFGYFPSYALGCLIAAQLWEAIEADLGPQDERLREADVAPLKRWLAEKVHRHGRRLDTIPLLEHATGRGIEVEPFLRYARAISGL